MPDFQSHELTNNSYTVNIISLQPSNKMLTIKMITKDSESHESLCLVRLIFLSDFVRF